jgi:hypothetical protein
MVDILKSLSELEQEILDAQEMAPGRDRAHALAKIEAKLSMTEAVAKANSDDSHEYDDQLDEMDGDDDDGDDDDDDEDDPELSTSRNRERMFNRGQPEQYQKAYGGSPLPMHHKFETVVQRISSERNIPKAEAAAVARKENPTLFSDYQQSGLQGNATQSQQRLVALEVAKGFSPEVAAVRVAHAYGVVPQDLAKSANENPVLKFNRVVTKIMEERGVERTEALRLARKRNPSLFAKYCEC